MKLMYKGLVVLIILLTNVKSFSQPFLPCPSYKINRTLVQTRLDEQEDAKTFSNARVEGAQPKYRFKVVQHVFRRSFLDGESFSYSADPELLASSINVLNEAFSPIDIEFVACEVNYIDVKSLPSEFNSDYQRGKDEIKYCDPNDVSDAINIYYFVNINYTDANGNTARIAGRSDNRWLGMPGNRIIIDPAVGDKASMVHEMGHFFGLFHTFENTFGFEYADESNCSSAGDLVCDTPAEPSPDNSGLTANIVFSKGSCVYKGLKYDLHNDLYQPLTDNYMTYVNELVPTCRKSFTQGQYDRMRIYGIPDRLSLVIPYEFVFNLPIYQSTFHAPHSGSIVTINKLTAANISSASAITHNSDVQFIGERIVLAKGFSVEKGSKFRATHKDFCNIPGGNNASYMYGLLRTEQLVSSDQNLLDQAAFVEQMLSVVPNPNSGEAKIVFSSPAESEGAIAVYDMMGRKVLAWSDLLFKEGQNEFPVSITPYGFGIYHAVVESGGKKHSFRFVVQP